MPTAAGADPRSPNRSGKGPEAMGAASGAASLMGRKLPCRPRRRPSITAAEAARKPLPAREIPRRAGHAAAPAGRRLVCGRRAAGDIHQERSAAAARRASIEAGTPSLARVQRSRRASPEGRRSRSTAARRPESPARQLCPAGPRPVDQLSPRSGNGARRQRGRDSHRNHRRGRGRGIRSVPMDQPHAEGRAATAAADPDAGECPFLASDDARCGARFTVNGLDDFFALCCGSYRRCPTYHVLRREALARTVDVDTGSAAARRPSASLPEVPLTADGHPLRIRSELP